MGFARALTCPVYGIILYKMTDANSAYQVSQIVFNLLFAVFGVWLVVKARSWQRRENKSTGRQLSIVLFYAVGILILLGLLGSLVMAARVEDADAPRQASSQAESAMAAPTVQELLEATNQERAKAGVPALQLDERLNRSAQAKAADMEENHYYAHTNPETGQQGYDLIDATGIKCKPGSPAENIVQTEVGTPTASGALNAFMISKSHREALLSPDVDLVGFGISGRSVVQHFCDLQ